MSRDFRQVDVFTRTVLLGNPVAVVHDAEGLTDEAMQRFARWTNLSETTFLLPPTEPGADYRVRIFMPTGELPFAGHPTLGTCHAWLEAGGVPAGGDVVQECGVGLVRVRRTAHGLAFAAPPRRRSGPLEEDTLQRACDAMGLAPGDVVAAEWLDNGPGWVGLLLADADAVLAVRPGPLDLDVGVLGVHPPGSEAAIEVRGFFPKDGMAVEDPVTGSLNAAIGQWMVGSGRLAAPYVAAQGTVLGRAGRVHVTTDPDGTVWVGGGTVTCIRGTVELP